MNSDQITHDSNRNDGNVVFLHRFSDGRGLTPLRQVEAYWSALRPGADVPKRAQIDPRGMENVLEYAFILERIAPGIARIRLAGLHLNELAGMEVRGMPLSAFFTPSGRTQLSAVLEHVFETPAVAELVLQGKSRFGRAKPEVRMILLPMRDEAGNITRALGVLVANDIKAHSGLHLSVVDTVLRPVSGFYHAETPKPMAGFAEAQEPLNVPDADPMTGPAPGPATHLRLV
ncbi:MAG: hypothetical protein ACI9BH_001842 [Paracoccaceae bacterium]|jgi:hypothetical protein